MFLINKAIGDVTILNVDIESLASYEAKEIKNEILSKIDGNHKKIVINLEKVRFVDSEGIKTLAFCAREAISLGVEFRLSNLTEPAKRIFELLRLHEFFIIYKSENEALRSFY
jgi:anti-anti-sigma factor